MVSTTYLAAQAVSQEDEMVEINLLIVLVTVWQ